MKLPAYAIQVILVLTFFVAAGTRFASTSESEDPYFHGASAHSYRLALKVADGQRLGDLDKLAAAPEGFRPDRTQPVAMEFLVGYTFKIAKYFSEIDPRTYSRRFMVFLFALCVFTFYLLARHMWDCQAAGLFAALLVAFFSPLIEATNGREFAHLPFALFLVSVHLVLLQAYFRTGNARWSILASFVVMLLLASWEVGSYYALGVVLWMAFIHRGDTAEQRWVVWPHAAVFIGASLMTPFLAASRVLFSWQAAGMLAVAASLIKPGFVTGRTREKVAVAGATFLLTLIFTPLRSGAEAGVPGLEYVLTRLRFIAGKPADPGLVPEAIRAVWGTAHSTPSMHALLDFFVPIVFLLPPAIGGLRAWAGARGRTVTMATAALAAVVCVAYLFDRSAVAPASFALIPVLAVSLRDMGNHTTSRGPFVALGAALVLAQVLFPTGAVNASYQIAKVTNVAHADDNQFMRVSLENTDKELIRHIAQRTAVSNVFLGLPDISGLVTAFSGRSSATLPLNPGGATAAGQIELLKQFYRTEEALYDTCKERGVDYVIYSIDFLLDTTRYSPGYLAGQRIIPDGTVAYAMHFQPETLEHFSLVYENDHYRLFKVVETYQPIFATDHPPVYQYEIMQINNDDYASFADRVVQLVLVYSDAMASKARGDLRNALFKFNWCVGQAPHFTLAKIGQATTLIQAGQPQDARDALLGVLAYAPDNALALYHAAYVAAQLDEPEQAKSYLKLLYSSTTDRDLLEKAGLLQAFLDQGIPLTPETELQ